jgi:hypothetical protein
LFVFAEVRSRLLTTLARGLQQFAVVDSIVSPPTLCVPRSCDELELEAVATGGVGGRDAGPVLCSGKFYCTTIVYTCTTIEYTCTTIEYTCTTIEYTYT